MVRNIDADSADACGEKNSNFNLIYFYLFLIFNVDQINLINLGHNLML